MSVWTMSSGAMVMSRESFTHEFAGCGLEVHGTSGSVFACGEMTQEPVEEITLVTGKRMEIVPYPEHGLYGAGVRKFTGAVSGQDELPSMDGTVSTHWQSRCQFARPHNPAAGQV